MTRALLSFFTVTGSAAYADTTVTLEKPVHLTNAEGSDVILNAGEYAIEPTEDWLRIIPSDGRPLMPS
mgnify:CR=1 FL=1